MTEACASSYKMTLMIPDPSQSCTCVVSFHTEQGWSAKPTGYCGNDSIWFQGYIVKDMVSTFVFSWMLLWRNSADMLHNNIQVTLQKCTWHELRLATNHASELFLWICQCLSNLQKTAAPFNILIAAWDFHKTSREAVPRFLTFRNCWGNTCLLLQTTRFGIIRYYSNR